MSLKATTNMKPRLKLRLDGSVEVLTAGPTGSSAREAGAKTATEMHPEQIKAAIRMTGTTPAALADSMSRSRMLISNVIHGRVVSRPVADRIAALLKTKPNKLWPDKYQEKKRVA